MVTKKSCAETGMVDIVAAVCIETMCIAPINYASALSSINRWGDKSSAQTMCGLDPPFLFLAECGLKPEL